MWTPAHTTQDIRVQAHAHTCTFYTVLVTNALQYNTHIHVSTYTICTDSTHIYTHAHTTHTYTDTLHTYTHTFYMSLKLSSVKYRHY